MDTPTMTRHAEQAPTHIKEMAKEEVGAFKREILETVSQWIADMELEEGLTAAGLQKRIVGAIRIGLIRRKSGAGSPLIVEQNSNK